METKVEDQEKEIVNEGKEATTNGDWIPIKECRNFPTHPDPGFGDFYIEQLRQQMDDTRVQDIETFLSGVNALWHARN